MKIAQGDVFIRCLSTTDLQAAVVQRPYLDIEFDREVARLRARIDQQARALCDSEVDRLFAVWMQREIATWQVGVPAQNLSDDEHAHWQECFNIMEAEMTHSLGRGRFKPNIESRLHSDLEAMGVKPDLGHPGYHRFIGLAGRGLLEMARMRASRLRGEFGYQFVDQEVAKAAGANDVAPLAIHTVSDLIERYEAEKKPGWSQSTVVAYEPIWRVLREALGASRDVASITRDDGRALFDLIQRIPLHVSKKKALRDLPFRAAIEEGGRLGLAKLSAKTINDSYLGLMTAVFGWAVREQWMAANPIAGLRMHDPIPADKKRDPFTSAQVEKLFSTAPWSDGDIGDPIKYWAPLVALMTGMRVGEIAALRKWDVREQDGTWMIYIERGKTKNARRMIPVHPALQRLGFIEYVEARRLMADRDDMLFAGERPGAKGQWGRNTSFWLQERVKALRLAGKKLGMHSFRHSFEDALRQADLHETPVGQYLTGRVGERDRSSSAAYGWGYSSRKLADAMATVQYPALDLSHLIEARRAVSLRG